MDGSGRDYLTLRAVDSVICAVQLTDTHLCQRPGGTLLAMDTDHSLQAVIDRVLSERERVDLVLGTGDLANGGAPEAYRRLIGYFSRVSRDHYWLTGNHDDRAAMEAVLDRRERLSRELRIGCWQILMLDSQVPGAVAGELGRKEILALERDLVAAEEASLFTLVCLHHQPVRVGCEWLDEQMVADADEFFTVLERFPGVRGVLWGHVHQEVDSDHRGMRLMASPSTCVQFAPGSARFKADDQPPGYRWLDLHGDGRIESGVSRVTGVEFTVDLESGGYL